MNDDAKKKLKEKMGALVTDEELDQVAGGTNTENLELLGVLAKVDPARVKYVFNIVNEWPGDEYQKYRENFFKSQVSSIIEQNFGGRIKIENSIEGKNKYYYKGKPVSHEQVVDIIDAEGWETL